MLDTEISKSENNIIQDEFLVSDEPVMKSALEVLTKIAKTDKIKIKGKGELCYNAVSICNIIVENIGKGNSKIENITVDSEILDDGRMVSTIELVLIKTN
jgi:DNA-binding protein